MKETNNNIKSNTCPGCGRNTHECTCMAKTKEK